MTKKQTTVISKSIPVPPASLSEILKIPNNYYFVHLAKCLEQNNLDINKIDRKNVSQLANYCDKVASLLKSEILKNIKGA